MAAKEKQSRPFRSGTGEIVCRRIDDARFAMGGYFLVVVGITSHTGPRNLKRRIIYSGAPGSIKRKSSGESGGSREIVAMFVQAGVGMSNVT